MIFSCDRISNSRRGVVKGSNVFEQFSTTTLESQWIVGGLVKGWFLRKKLLKGIMQHCKSVFDSYNTHYVLYILFLSSYQQMRSDWLLT